MFESTFELLCGLLLISLTFLIGACVVGSIVAALRAVSSGSTIVRGRKEAPLSRLNRRAYHY
jgi:hypothetical protein